MRHRHTTASRLQRLHRIPGLDLLPVDTIERLDRMSTETIVRAGRLLMRQGDHGREAFVIAEGSAAVRRDGRLVAVVSAGSLVGDVALREGGRRTADVIALTDMTLLVMSPPELTSLCDDVHFAAWSDAQIASRSVARTPAGPFRTADRGSLEAPSPR